MAKLNPFLISLTCLGLIGFLSSCKVINTTKYQFTDGVYTHLQTKVYVAETLDDTIRVYKVSPVKNNNQIYFSLPAFLDTSIQAQKFSQHTFDLDFLTIPLKYRSSKKDVPPQFNTTLNGSIYFGYRTDKYSVTYEPNPVLHTNRQIKHIGFSGGVFMGLGNTTVNPTTTNNSIDMEYDGVILQKGIALIMGINKITVGATLGFDNLIDKNKNNWIYQNKPWIGLAFGLNLN